MFQAVRSYLLAGRQAGLSDATLRQYAWHLGGLTNWLLDRDVVGVAGVTRDLLREWGAGLRDACPRSGRRGWSPATVKQAVGAARALFLWCHDEGIIDSDPGRALKVPRVPKRVQRTITSGEVAALLGVCDSATVKGARDAALVLFLVDTALRSAEVCRCELTKLDLGRRCVLVVVKGGREDLAYYGASTAARLDVWLAARPGVAVAGEDAVFVSVGGNTPGEAITVPGLRSILGALGRKAGLKGVTTHAFRRAFACIATEAGAPSREVQLGGRWGNIRMVEDYTRALRRGQMHRRWSPADYVENNHLGR